MNGGSASYRNVTPLCPLWFWRKLPKGTLTLPRGVCKVSRLFPVVEVVPEVHALAAAYFAAIPLPDKAQADAYHLALAAWHGVDYLVSWNCTHIVSGRVRMILEEVNAEFGIRTPIICTPEELMEIV